MIWHLATLNNNNKHILGSYLESIRHFRRRAAQSGAVRGGAERRRAAQQELFLAAREGAGRRGAARSGGIWRRKAARSGAERSVVEFGGVPKGVFWPAGVNSSSLLFPTALQERSPGVDPAWQCLCSLPL